MSEIDLVMRNPKELSKALIELNTKLFVKGKEIERLNNIINEAIKYIKEHCIDDEFYINLSDKEKGIVDVLTILENGVDKE